MLLCGISTAVSRHHAIEAQEPSSSRPNQTLLALLEDQYNWEWVSSSRVYRYLEVLLYLEAGLFRLPHGGFRLPERASVVPVHRNDSLKLSLFFFHPPLRRRLLCPLNTQYDQRFVGGAFTGSRVVALVSSKTRPFFDGL